MGNFLNDAFNAVSGQDFEEQPVDIETFISSPEYLNMGRIKLSHYQLGLISAMSQIYKEETLYAIMPKEKARIRWAETCREIIMVLGKGAGKDFTSTVAVSYMVYLLLCLRNPAEYYGKPDGDAIDIINIAINADQAQRVFFEGFMNKIKNSPWFEGRYDPKANFVKFDKNVTVYSGHSEREGFEGYNTIAVILDEISGFAMDSASGNPNAKTAPAIYKMYKASVTSRFSKNGKLILLSFPRYEEDFIMGRYNKVIAEKEVVYRSETLKRDVNLPDGVNGNEFEVSWEEDHIVSYKSPNIFALKRPSWEVNPTKDLQEDYAADFDDDMGDSLQRFACMPNNQVDGYFSNTDKVEETFAGTNGVDESGVFHPNFRPNDDVKYYMHVDLAQKHDYCAVSMAHVESWKRVSTGGAEEDIVPIVKVDAVRWWTPTKQKTVDFADVVSYIKSVRRRGFNLTLVTFDRWNSNDTMLDLNRAGINTENLSVATKHYDDFKMIMYDDRLKGPHVELLIKELSNLRLIKGKVDHPAKSSKDLSDATCGAIYNAVSLTKPEQSRMVDVLTLDDLEEQMRPKVNREQYLDDLGVVKVPSKQAPQEIQDLLDMIRLV